MLKSNRQYANGGLNKSISAVRFDKMVTVSSSINSETKILDNVSISIEIPWGNYGVKLDSEYGSSENAESQMIPSIDALLRWIKAKNIPVKSYVTSSLKSGEKKTYGPYTGRTGSKIMAWNIQQNIINENELRTRYDYAERIRLDFQDILDVAINNWVAEMAEAQYVDVLVELDELY
tara:strand:+ start:3546 stop:4076 length:531 start_codon:yes stop_codon:yes gene_type:complete